MKLPGTIILAAATEDFNSSLLIPLPGNATAAPESVSMLSASQTYGGGSHCFICADRATGKHYGASSCDGCKGFFRRSIRSNQTYNCRFNRQCVVDKDKRNQCRYCRLRKCFKAGMRKEAVQNERDCINPHRVKGQPVGTLSINVLLQAENSVQQSHDISTKKTACVGDVFESMKQQLLLLVEWAKHIPEFCSLHIDDRVTLLRTHSAEHLILGAARRSLPYNDVILLGNNFVIPLRGAELEVSRVAIRIQEELVKPLRELDITDKEFACLRSIVFFAPDCPGLENSQVIRYLRLQAHVLLEEATCDQRGRLGELLLILPALQSVSWQMVETLHLAKLLGEARLDSLLQEMLLGEGTATNQGQGAGSILNCERQNDLRPSPATFTSELPGFNYGNTFKRENRTHFYPRPTFQLILDQPEAAPRPQWINILSLQQVLHLVPVPGQPPKEETHET